jgi:hypothetical protein
MYNLSDLKNRMVSIEEGSAVFYLHAGIGDKLMYLSQLNNFASLFRCKITLFSKAGASDDLVNFFSNLRGRHLALPAELYDGYSDEEFVDQICDQAPGPGKIFPTWYLRHRDRDVIRAWLLRNSKDYNVFRLAKQQLGLVSDAPADLVEMSPLSMGQPSLGDYILLCPLANTVNQLLPVEFWGQLAMNFQKLGYKCIVNSSALPAKHADFKLHLLREWGCELVDVNLNAFLHMAANAKHIYTIRSGLADLLSLTPRLNWSVFNPPEFSHLDQFLTCDHGAGSKPKLELTVDANVSHVVEQAVRVLIE